MVIHLEVRSPIHHNLLLGPTLPFSSTGYTMVTSPDGQGVMVIGGYNEDEDDHSSIYELRGNPLRWTLLKQKLKYPRKWHVSIPIH